MSNVILLAVDGSPDARGAARFVAERFALSSGDYELRLIHVQYKIPPHAASSVGRETVEAYYRSETEKAVKVVRTLLEAKKVPYQGVRRVGNPGTEIARYATAEAADLIVMGSHGLGAAKGLLLGSVTQQVIAGCSVPLLVVRAGGARGYSGGVLIAVDGSAFTRRAIMYLLRRRELLAAGAKITLINVTAPQSRFPFSTKKSQEREALDTEYERMMRPARRFLSRAHVEWQEVRAHGDPGAEIAAYARRHDHGLIVMGSHGRSAMTGLLLGSVAQKTLSACRAPVLIVR